MKQQPAEFKHFDIDELKQLEKLFTEKAKRAQSNVALIKREIKQRRRVLVSEAV
jgi:hypothetical protein